jgi:hypothetical protein
MCDRGSRVRLGRRLLAGSMNHSLLMGVFWLAAIFIYGYGAWIMGDGGTTYGWAIVSGAGILGSLLLGTFTGEWKGSGLKAKVLMGFSVATMALSFAILAIP